MAGGAGLPDVELRLHLERLYLNSRSGGGSMDGPWGSSSGSFVGGGAGLR